MAKNLIAQVIDFSAIATAAQLPIKDIEKLAEE
jgi:hypothetical protein